MASLIKIPVHNGTMDVYLGAPDRRAPGPAIVLMYHRGGIDDFTKLAAKRLVDRGYLVVVPDVYHVAPTDMPMPERKSLLTDDGVVADVRATMAMLRERADVDPARIVIMGHCMGGRMTILAAGRVPSFCAAIVYYGGGVARSWGDGVAPFQTLRDIRCPVIGFFGNKDKNPSPEDVNEIDAELAKYNIVHDFHRYPEVGHGFQNPAHDAPQERPAAEDAWMKTFAFLRKVAPT